MIREQMSIEIADDWASRARRMHTNYFEISLPDERIVELLKSVTAHVEALGPVDMFSIIVTNDWNGDEFQVTARVEWADRDEN